MGSFAFEKPGFWARGIREFKSHKHKKACPWEGEAPAEPLRLHQGTGSAGASPSQFPDTLSRSSRAFFLKVTHRPFVKTMVSESYHLSISSPMA